MALPNSALSKLDIEIDVTQPLGNYSVAIQQMVAIARSLEISSAKILILDEPTSSLDVNEANQLFKVMKKLKGEGIGIIFITHFLDQVYQVSDRITVLRNGSAGWHLQHSIAATHRVDCQDAGAYHHRIGSGV